MPDILSRILRLTLDPANETIGILLSYGIAEEVQFKVKAHPETQTAYLSGAVIEQRSGIDHKTIFKPGGAAQQASAMGLVYFESPGERDGWVDGHALAGSWTTGHGEIKPVTVLDQLDPKQRAKVERFLDPKNALWSSKQLGHNGWRLAATLIARHGILEDILLTTAEVARIIGTSTRRANALLAKPDSKLLVDNGTQNFLGEVPVKRGRYAVRLWSRVFSLSSDFGFEDVFDRYLADEDQRKDAYWQRLADFYDYKRAEQEAEVYDPDVDPDNIIPAMDDVPDVEDDTQIPRMDEDGERYQTICGIDEVIEAEYPYAEAEAVVVKLNPPDWHPSTPEPAQDDSAPVTGAMLAESFRVSFEASLKAAAEAQGRRYKPLKYVPRDTQPKPSPDAPKAGRHLHLVPQSDSESSIAV